MTYGRGAGETGKMEKLQDVPGRAKGGEYKVRQMEQPTGGHEECVEGVDAWAWVIFRTTLIIPVPRKKKKEPIRNGKIKKGFFEGATESGRKKCRKDLQARQKTAIQCLSDEIR